MSIAKFWDHCCSTGFLQADHPGRGKNPVGIYGDDCRYNKIGEKLVALNFNCILQEPKSIWIRSLTFFIFFYGFRWHFEYLCIKNKTHLFIQQGLDMCRFPIFVLRNSRLIPEYTLERVYHVIAWSFRLLALLLSLF